MSYESNRDVPEARALLKRLATERAAREAAEQANESPSTTGSLADFNDTASRVFLDQSKAAASELPVPNLAEVPAIVSEVGEPIADQVAAVEADAAALPASFEVVAQTETGPEEAFRMDDAPTVEATAPAAEKWYEKLVKRAVRFVQDIPGLIEHQKKLWDLPRLKVERELWHDRMTAMFSKDDTMRNTAKEEAIGTTIDLGTKQKYKIEKFLGKGGFGAAYLAQDLRGKRCVVKLSKPFNREAMFATREKRTFTGAEIGTARTLILEVAALKRLNKLGEQNPGPALLDAQFMPDPRNPDLRVAVVVMDYVEGGSLVRYVGKNTEEPLKMVDALQQVTEHLATAHEAGIIHSDIRPGNVMVDVTGKAKLIDFGGAILPDLTDQQNQAKPDFNSDTGRRAVYAQRLGSGTYTESFVVPGEIASKERDRYSLGRTIQFLVFRKPRYLDPAAMQEHRNTLSYPLRELADIADQLVRAEPTQRISLKRTRELLNQLTATEQQIEHVQEQIGQQAANG